MPVDPVNDQDDDLIDDPVDDSITTDCAIGFVVDYYNCKKAALIQVESPVDLGKEIIFVNDSLYSNAIQVPGETDVYGNDTIYFSYVIYDKKTHSKLFNTSGPPCPPLYDVFEVPIFVIIDFSDSVCP